MEIEKAKPNGVASAGDFKKLAEDAAFEPEQRVVLPKSGLAVLLRRPRPVAFTLFARPLPASLAAPSGSASPAPRTCGFDEPQDRKAGPALQMTAEELQALSKFWVAIFERMFVQPRLSLNPGPAEIHPNWLSAGDVQFLIRWAVGEVASDGSDLAEFRRAGRPSAAPRATGGDVELPPVGAAVEDNAGFPN